MGHYHDPERFVEEVRASQRNIVSSDTVRNGIAVDAFLAVRPPIRPLFRGSPLGC